MFKKKWEAEEGEEEGQPRMSLEKEGKLQRNLIRV